MTSVIIILRSIFEGEFCVKHKTILKIIFLSLVLSSCGLIERFKTPEQPTDSKDSTAAATGDESTAYPSADKTANSADDLFNKTMDETNNTQTANADAPNNISNNSDVKTEAPVLVEEALPEIKTEEPAPEYSEAGKIKTYRVQKGETLMQIAFKLYGDIGKWKEIKNMNSEKVTKNTFLKANTELKYKAPETPFVWNPAGTPYMIKNTDTLGTISNSVYGTKKKWKAIWANNKPLIKNPNVIYAGFTLYYTNGGMANFVQPKSVQPAKQMATNEHVNSEPQKEVSAKVEEVNVDQESKAPASVASKEIDLTNNVTAPVDQNEIAPDVDPEVQSL
jgi:nucleoid-associated protein YgaU